MTLAATLVLISLSARVRSGAWARGLGSALAVATLFGASPLSARAQEATTLTATSPEGISIAYETRGAGSPALVFVHGWSCDRSYWAAQMEAFSRDFQVVAVDLAGHGESGFGREAWTMAGFGGDVAAVVEELALDRVILVGHSMGGDAIVEAARRLPDRVAGLVWVDTYRALGTPRTQGQLDAILAPMRDNFVGATRAFVSGMFLPSADPTLVERVVSDMSSAPQEVALEALASALSFDREMPRLVLELGLPIVAINPEQPASNVASLDRHGVEVLLMPGVGHFLMLENPEGFEALLRTAIDRIGP